MFRSTGARSASVLHFAVVMLKLSSLVNLLDCSRFPPFLRQAWWYVLFLQSARDWVVSVLVWFLLFGPKHNFSLHD